MLWRGIRKWQVLGVLAFGVPLIAIAFVQYRWLEELRQRSEMLTAQQNREAALRTVSLLEEELTGARLQVLPAVAHADICELRLDSMKRVFDEGFQRFPYIDRFFVWAPPQARSETLFYDPGGGVFTTDGERLRQFPLDVWELNGGALRFAEFRCLSRGPPCQIVVHRILDGGDSVLQGIVGFTVDLEAFAAKYLPPLFETRLKPAVQRLLELDEVAVGFFNEKGEKVFGTAESVDRPTVSSADISVSFATPTEGIMGRPEGPQWKISVGKENEHYVHAIVRRGALSNLAIVGAGILALALGSVLIARSSAREARLSDLKSRFISGISHELKTPLSMIRLYSELLELGRVPSNIERKIFYRNLSQQAEIMADMLEEILDFSRLEAEQQQGRKASCCVEEILEEAVEMHDTRSMAQHSIALSVGDGLPPILGNRSALVRVFYNLLDNASKYSQADRPIVVAAYRRNGMVAVEVADEGIGIGSDELPHIFDRFYRGRTPAGTKGTGLGLSIVHTVVKSHGGEVEVESEVGQGSRFTVLLPIEAPPSARKA